MSPVTISEVAVLTERAERAASRVEALMDDEVAREVLPPLPLRLVLPNLEAWLDRAEENAKRPKAAKSRERLLESRIDPAGVPSSVLEATEDVSRLLSAAKGLPAPLTDKAMGELGAALTKSVEDGEKVLEKYQQAADSANPLNRVKGRSPWLVSASMREVSEHPHQAESIVQRAMALASAWSDATNLKIVAPSASATLAESEEALTAFQKSLTALNEVLTREGLGRDEIPDLEGKALGEAAVALPSVVAKLEQEKHSLQERCHTLAEGLAALAVPGAEWGETIAELRADVQELENSLASERDRLRASLGAENLALLECLSKGELPARSKLTDEELGTGMRGLVDAGYRVSVEASGEDQ